MFRIRQVATEGVSEVRPQVPLARAGALANLPTASFRSSPASNPTNCVATTPSAKLSRPSSPPSSDRFSTSSGSHPGNSPSKPSVSRFTCGPIPSSRSAESRRYRFPDVDFRSVSVDDRPGRNDYVLGDVVGRRGGAREDFRFVCRVDLRSGRVRSADVFRR